MFEVLEIQCTGGVDEGAVYLGSPSPAIPQIDEE